MHLDTATAFWSYSVVQGVRGTPTEFMATFDPVASPAEMVAADDIPPAELLDRFIADSDRLTDTLTSLDDDGWHTPAEAPPGHISVTALAHHTLWDSWVHQPRHPPAARPPATSRSTRSSPPSATPRRSVRRWR